MNAVLTVQHINKSFGTGKNRQQVLFDISFSVNSGEIFGFLGPNGAGKSTVIKLLLNFLRPDTGSLKILNRQVGLDEFREKVGYLSELPFFFNHLTARETLLLSGRLSNVPERLLNERIAQLLKRMDLEDAAERRIFNFSKGMKQRLGMANALVHEPDILILDEPMSGLDPLGRYLIKEIITELKNEGKTVFFSSHILSDVEELCDRICVIHKGHPLYSGKTAHFMVKEKNFEEQFIQLIQDADHAILA